MRLYSTFYWIRFKIKSYMLDYHVVQRFHLCHTQIDSLLFAVISRIKDCDSITWCVQPRQRQES